jgi:hypothetical protein
MMTIKEWAAEYRLMNEWEQQERLERLPNEPVEQSIRTYFELSQLVQVLSRTADEAAELWPLRAKHYLDLTKRWQRLARRRARTIKRAPEKPEKKQDARQS